MKRIRIILGFLILGAIVNVAVAWGLATRSHALQTKYLVNRSTPRGEIYTNWRAKRIEKLGTLIIESSWQTPYVYPNYFMIPPDQDVNGILPNWAITHLAPKFIDDNLLSAERLMLASGWPCLSFWGLKSSHSTYGVTDTQSADTPEIWFEELPQTSLNAIDVQALSIPYGILPCAPIPRGFILNTLFYSALLWLILIIPLKFRGLIRHRRGLCTHCTYDLRGATPKSLQCPECGRRLVSSEPA